MLADFYNPRLFEEGRRKNHLGALYTEMYTLLKKRRQTVVTPKF